MTVRGRHWRYDRIAEAEGTVSTRAGAAETKSLLVTGIVTSPNGGMAQARFRLGSASGTQTLGTQLVPNGGARRFPDPRRPAHIGWAVRLVDEGLL